MMIDQLSEVHNWLGLLVLCGAASIFIILHLMNYYSDNRALGKALLVAVVMTTLISIALLVTNL